jgi:hypothetical protein
MSKEPKFELKYYDTQAKRARTIKGQDFANQFDKIKKAIEYMLGQMETLGHFELSEFTATAGLEANVFFLKADGSIEMKWTRIKKQ